MKTNDFVFIHKTPKRLPRTVNLTKKSGKLVYVDLDQVGIEFDFEIPIDGHNCDGCGRKGYCYYVERNCVTVINPVVKFD